MILKKKAHFNFKFKNYLIPLSIFALLAISTPFATAQDKTIFDTSSLSGRYASWGVEPTNKKSGINLVDAWKKLKIKKEVVVAVIDTGIDPNHPFLASNIHIPNGKVNRNHYGVDFSKNSLHKFRPKDDHGHGTHVSGIVKSVFPKVKILPLKYYNPQASGEDNLQSTIAALRYAVEQNVDIINYSGGGPKPALEEIRILKMAEKKGILIVAAAGNEKSNIDDKEKAYYPASYGLSNIITVAAHNQHVALLSSSNYGRNTVDLTAPGYRIKSSLPHGRAGYLTGTSQATAFVTGAAALIKAQYPHVTPAEIREIIKKSAYREFSLMSKCSSGGRLDTAKALKLASDLHSKEVGPKRGVANTKKTGTIHYRRLAK
jgi:subtilisin family serine protease